MKTAMYNFDIMSNTLTASAMFLKRASQLNTTEYLIVKQLRADNPGMKVVQAEKRSNQNRPVNITFKKMEEFIGLCADCEDRKKAFNKVRSLSKVQASPYKYVKTWFLENYANYSEQPEFDEKGFVIVKTREEMEAEQIAAKGKQDDSPKLDILPAKEEKKVANL